MELTILGSNSAIPAHDRHPSAQILRIGIHKFLIDCGEGTQMRMNDFGVRKFRINKIFISHLHGDHVFGLPGFLTTMNLQGRTTSVELYGPRGIKDFLLNIFKWSRVELGYELIFFECSCQDKELLFEDDEIEIYGFPLQHRIDTNGYLFVQKEGLRHLDGEKADALNIPFEWRHKLKRGLDYISEDGKLVVACEDITLPADPAISYAYCSDTRCTQQIIPWIKGADCVYHEATYLHALVSQAHERYHTTALEAAELAVAAQVGKLLIGHHSSRYADPRELEAEAKRVFPDTESVVEGETYLF